MANWGEDVDYEAQELKDHEGRFTINFKKIYMDVDEINEKTLEITDKHPKDSLLKLWAGTMVGITICFFLCYQVFILAAVPFIVFYLIALFRIFKCWKGFKYNSAQFWLMSLAAMSVAFAITRVVYFFVDKGTL